jgi:hypothetical protein
MSSFVKFGAKLRPDQMAIGNKQSAEAFLQRNLFCTFDTSK